MATKKIKIPKEVIKEQKFSDKVDDQKKRKKELYEKKEWYTIRALLGNQWANWFIMAGARERSEGKHFQFRISY